VRKKTEQKSKNKKKQPHINVYPVCFFALFLLFQNSCLIFFAFVFSFFKKWFAFFALVFVFYFVCSLKVGLRHFTKVDMFFGQYQEVCTSSARCVAASG
jgi:hypothetical protein